MNTTENGITLFESIGPEQMGAVNLVLASLGNGPLEKEPAVRALLMRSGVSGPIVNARKCLCFALRLGLIYERGEEFALSPLGKELYATASWPPYNVLSEAQGRLLLTEMVQRPDFAVPLANLIRRMRRLPDGSLEIVPGSVQLPRAELQCLHALQSLSAMQYSKGVLILRIEAYDTITSVLGISAAVTEEELARILELQRIRAVAAENYVMGLEIERLTNGNRLDLAGLVERVAARDVAAGFDIRSFELDGSDRFIEVKSSTGTDVKFFLTRNELSFLKEHDRVAWIYFVPRVHELPSPSYQVIAIPNPLAWITECATVEASEYLVQFSPLVSSASPDHGSIVWLQSIGHRKADIRIMGD